MARSRPRRRVRTITVAGLALVLLGAHVLTMDPVIVPDPSFVPIIDPSLLEPDEDELPLRNGVVDDDQYMLEAGGDAFQPGLNPEDEADPVVPRMAGH